MSAGRSHAGHCRVSASVTEDPYHWTGGQTEETILATIRAGANAITYTPPTSAQLFKVKMDKYRKMAQEEYEDTKKLS